MITQTYYPIYARELKDGKVEALPVDFRIQPIVANDMATAMLNARIEIEKEIVKRLSEGKDFPYGTNPLSVPAKDGYQVLGFDLNVANLLKHGTETGMKLEEITIKIKLPKWLRDRLPKKNQDVQKAFFDYFINHYDYQPKKEEKKVDNQQNK